MTGRTGDAPANKSLLRSASPPVAEQLIVGVVAAMIAWAVDMSIVVSDFDASVRWTRAIVIGALHLLAFMLLPATGIGVVVGTVLSALRRVRWLTPIRLRLGRPSSWLEADPEGFATGVALLATGAAYYVAMVRLATILPDRIATQQYIAVGIGVSAVLLALVAILAIALVAVILRPIAAHLGRIASIGVLGVAAGAFTVALVARRWDLISPLLEGQVGRRVLAAPIAVAAYLVAAILVRVVMSRASRARTHRIGGGVAVGLAVVALVASALTYGMLHGPREIVEGRSIYGPRLYRVYARLTDRDGDGYSAMFGGSDCDDSRANVYPGARDRRGDGIDADCFDGDGSRTVDALSDGAYAPVRGGLQRPNLLLITIDALRRDAVSSYGAKRGTPNIDRFARSSVQFDDAIAPSSRTISAMPAIMTGLYPSQLARGPEYFYPSVLAENVMLAETLKTAGYRTVGIAGTRFFSRVNGYYQGFDVVLQTQTEHSERGWPVDRAIEQLETLTATPDQPWFMWVHLFNVHAPYLWDGAASRYGVAAKDRYDTEVAFSDQEVGRLMAAITRKGLDGRTAVVITSDHGEAFGEHGTLYHEMAYEEELRVPLLVRVPGYAPGVAWSETSTIDITPTLTNLAGVRLARPIAGRSMLTAMARASPIGTRRPAQVPEPRLIISERLPDGWMPIHILVLRRNHVRLTWYVEDDRLELHDLRADPAQLVNIADDRPAEANEMLAMLRAWLWQTGDARNLTEEIIARNRLSRVPDHMTARLDVHYPFFTLLGYDLPKTTYARGETIELTFYYRVTATTDKSARFRVDFDLPPTADDVLFFDAEHIPIEARYPTDRWRPGEILRDRVWVPVPTFLPPGIRARSKLLVGFEGHVIPWAGDPTGTGWLPLPEITIQ